MDLFELFDRAEKAASDTANLARLTYDGFEGLIIPDARSAEGVAYGIDGTERHAREAVAALSALRDAVFNSRK